MESSAVEIVVNKSVPAANYSVEDVRAIFTMKQRAWPNGKPIRVFTLEDTHYLHKNFVKSILLLFPHQLRRIWDRIAFSGTGAPPVQVGSEHEMLEKLSATPDSIGYLEKAPENDKIRLLDVR